MNSVHEHTTQDVSAKNVVEFGDVRVEISLGCRSLSIGTLDKVLQQAIMYKGDRIRQFLEYVFTNTQQSISSGGEPEVFRFDDFSFTASVVAELPIDARPIAYVVCDYLKDTIMTLGNMYRPLAHDFR